MAIEWHEYQWPWVSIKVTFAVWDLTHAHNSGKIIRFNYDVCTHELESTYGLWSCDLNFIVEREWIHTRTLQKL